MALQWSYDTQANWVAQNRTPLAGEVCVETDTLLIKKGDGTNAYNSLAYTSEGAQRDVPSYYPKIMLHKFDPRTSSYNLKQDNMHGIRADIKKVQAGSIDVHVLFMGDSTLIGYDGSTYKYDQSIPRSMVRALSHLLGDVPWTGGIQMATAASTAVVDNVTLSGGMTEAVQILTNNPTGSSASIGNFIAKSLDPCTSVEFYFSNISTNNFTYQIDGGSAVTVATTGASTMGKVTVSGLTKGIHTLQINGTAAISVYIYGWRFWDPNVKSIHLHNLGIGGAKANTSGTNGLNWSSTQSTAPQGLGWSGPQMLTQAGITPDVVCICAGNNDLFAGTTPANTITGLTNMRNYYSTTPCFFIHPPMVTGTNQTNFDDFSGRIITMCDTLDTMYFDWDDWDGRLTGYNADGLAGADGIHPIFAEQAAVGRHVCLLLTQADFQGPLDPVVATFSKSGTLTTGVGTFRWYNDSGRTLIVKSVRAAVGTAPTGATLILDIDLNGTTIYTTQANRPTIAISGNTIKSTNPDVTTIPDGGYITVDIDQIGSTVAGSDLTVTINMV